MKRAAPVTLPQRATETPSNPRQGRQFLVGPIFDLFFLANLYWPLLFVIDFLGQEDWHHGLLFWQVYFVTAPHRWITVILVGADRTKTRGREGRFLLVTGAIVTGCLLLRWQSSSLLCLGAIDYAWNAWHFASQHHGIFRIYQRKETATPVFGGWEKWCFRGFLLYVIARVAGVGWQVGPADWTWQLQTLDPVVVLLPATLLIQQIRREGFRVLSTGTIYFGSVMSLFLAMLLAAHFERRQLVLQFALDRKSVVSVEYFAIVTWTTSSQTQHNRRDLIGTMARNWSLFLLFFMGFLGITGYLMATGYTQVWVLINVMVAFLHYAYDGMIWKARRPAATGGAT
ncbi:MAG: hypothetical protein KDA80_18330 [Planctomycetaceae bacterium]|nr:hypothetical protein [Planctomycetaceae bacterium]